MNAIEQLISPPDEESLDNNVKYTLSVARRLEINDVIYNSINQGQTKYANDFVMCTLEQSTPWSETSSQSRFKHNHASLNNKYLKLITFNDS